MIHAGIFHHIMANFPAGVPIGFPFAPPIHSSPPPSPPSCQSSWPQRTHNSKASAFSIDAILGRPVQQQNTINIIQSQQQHNQQQYQQHLQKKAVENQQQQHHQQQQQHHQLSYHRISRPAPYPSSVSSGSVNDITSAGNNIIVSGSNINNNSSSVRNNSNGGSGGKATKSKRIRTIFTAEQLERLEAEFARQQYMVGPERVYLAATLQLSEAQVKVWFQNRRIKWRKQYMESQHARFQDHPLSESPTDRAESRSPTSPIPDVDAVSTHDTSDDDRAMRQGSVDRHLSVDLGSSLPPRRPSSLSPPPHNSGQASRSPSPSSSSESSSSPPSSPGANDNHILSHCDGASKAVDGHNALNISYSNSVPPTLSHYLSVSQLNSSMLAVKDQLTKAQRSLH